MEYRAKNMGYEAEISFGTAGVSIALGEDFKETSKLVFLTRNKVMTCGQNQY
jgi:hypothetical protein